jgi:hypothetical protein
MQLLLHLVQFLAALVQVPIHPLLVGLQRLVDLVGELASLSLSAAILFGLLTRRSPPRLGQSSPRREDGPDDRQRNQSDARHQTSLHVRSPSVNEIGGVAGSEPEETTHHCARPNAAQSPKRSKSSAREPLQARKIAGIGVAME